MLKKVEYVDKVTVIQAENLNAIQDAIIELEKNSSGTVSKDDQDIYITPFSDRSPAALFGGTWERLKDRFILAAGDIYAAGSTGGEATHTLTIDEMPAHAHYDGSNLNYTFDASEGNQSCQLLGDASLGRPTTSTGGSQHHNNMPPYLAMYIWIRVKEEAAV